MKIPLIPNLFADPTAAPRAWPCGIFGFALGLEGSEEGAAPEGMGKRQESRSTTQTVLEWLKQDQFRQCGGIYSNICTECLEQGA